jgi:protein TonB
LVAPVLIRKVAPVYPAGIRGSHLQGTVVLQAVVLTDGTIGSIKTVSGDPMLRQAAAQAVKQWRYRPAYLNGKPQESSVSVEVVFPRSGEQ